MAKLLGKVDIFVNGRVLRTREGASIDLGGNEREMQKGSSAVHGYTEKIKESMIECVVLVAQGDELETLRNMTDGTAEFRADTGQKYLVSGATVIDTLKLTEGKGGDIAVKIAGQPAVPV